MYLNKQQESRKRSCVYITARPYITLPCMLSPPTRDLYLFRGTGPRVFISEAQHFMVPTYMYFFFKSMRRENRRSLLLHFIPPRLKAILIFFKYFFWTCLNNQLNEVIAQFQEHGSKSSRSRYNHADEDVCKLTQRWACLIRFVAVQEASYS